MFKLLCKMLSPIISTFLIVICKLWVIVEFLLYLIKDNPFTWWSLVFLGLSYIYFLYSTFDLITTSGDSIVQSSKEKQNDKG